MKIPENKRDRDGSFRPTAEVMAAWEQTRAFAKALNARIVVFQCPTSFRPTPENLDNMRTLFRSIKERDLTFAWEPRGNRDASTIASLCDELGLAHCVDPFMHKALYGTLTYYRLHGREAYKYKYTETDLAELLNACAGKRLCYCMFNNVSTFDDARAFQALLTRQLTS